MTKPRLAKVRALFYVLQQGKKRGCAYFDTASYVGLTNLPTLSVSYTGFSPSHEVYQRQIPHKVGGGPFQSHISESITKIQQLFHINGMKLYLSIPISGRPLHEAKNQAERIKAKLTSYGHECISKFEVCPEPNQSYAYYMGRDIEALLSDDIEGVIFGAGFHYSKGCQLEHAAAKIYN